MRGGLANINTTLIPILDIFKQFYKHGKISSIRTLISLSVQRNFKRSLKRTIALTIINETLSDPRTKI